MFEDFCLQCDKAMLNDNKSEPYCSPLCASNAAGSPSASSASSALSSPSIAYAHGPEVPPLVLPKILSATLGRYKRDPLYLSSSSASSNSWSLATDDDEDDLSFNADRGLSYRDDSDAVYDGSAKSAYYISVKPSPALSYARRPSGTNNHSTVPQVSNRSSSRSSPPHRPHMRGTAQSAPIASHSSSTDDSEEFSDSSRDLDSVNFPLKPSSARHARKRDSLPSFFNLLRINSSSTEAMKASPVLSSSGNTVARASPPTPRNMCPSSVLKILDSPRGRRRHIEDSRCPRPPQESSPSRSRSRHMPSQSPRAVRVRAVMGHDAEQPRGRSTMRRNNSPPPRALAGAEVPARVRSALRDAERSQSNCSSRTRGRGRVHVDELDGVGCFPLAPGYGNGRSGLMDRSRMAALVDRVPI